MIAWCVNPLYALVLIPIYLIISVVLPACGIRGRRGIGMRYREQLGKSEIQRFWRVLQHSGYQIFGAGQAPHAEVEQANGKVNQAALGLTLHRQTIASFPELFVYLARILILIVRRRLRHPAASIIRWEPLPCPLRNGFSVLHFQSDFCGDEPAGEPMRRQNVSLKLKMQNRRTREPEHPVPLQ